MTGRIFDIQKFSIHDGPGIRTTVFLKGCPLRCAWCHNPEGISPQPVLSFMPEKCIGCGYCFRSCPQGGHVMNGDRHELTRGKCTSCGTCTQQCYAGALELIGRPATVEDVLHEVLADKPFYETSGGGMTLSGGEPFLQPQFTLELLQAARAAGLHNCVETCGMADFAHLQQAMPYVDMWLYDIKDTDNARHIQFTGAPNAIPLANFKRLYEAGAKILLRLPLVPGYNDRLDNFRGVAQLQRNMPNLLGVEIMPYHRLGTSKLSRLGLPQSMDVPAADNATLGAWIDSLASLGVQVINTRPV